MSNNAIITARISVELLARLDQLAARLDRSRAWVVGQALTRYADKELAFLEFVQEGEDAIERGEYFTQEEMEAWFAARRQTPHAAAAE